MELYVERWGDGERVAVLVHGATDDHTTWHRVGPHLAAQGFTVLAPDLRGHGKTGPADSYLLDDFAGDLVDSLPSTPHLLLGHSLGALAVSRAIALGGLRPRSVVYVDPPWRTSPDGLADVAPPRWSEEEQTIDLDSTLRTDPALAEWIPARMLADLPNAIPDRLTAPSLVLEPELRALTDPMIRGELQRKGFVFTSLPGVRHVMHRDDLDLFLAALDAWTSSVRLP